MVAKIESGKSLNGALNYNERKVKAGKARLLKASGYAKSSVLLTFQDKLQRLTDLAARNIRTRTNTVHLSLNFDVSERLPAEKLMTIADEYMKRIGFGDQPYLVYEHIDAGHPHIHILTTNIQADGKRISLNNIGKLRSEPARKALEIEFGLVKAGERSHHLTMRDVPLIKPLQYGTEDTKRQISNIVNEVARSYKYTSLTEFNALLGLFRVTAYRGAPDSVMYKKGGLNYWATDLQGIRIGVPIKASTIYHRPTLALLEGRFKLNQYLRKPFKEPLRNKIDQALVHSRSLTDLKDRLENLQVILVVRQNVEGRIYGMSFVDQVAKTLFNGSDIGKAYSAGAIMASLGWHTVENTMRPAERDPAGVENKWPQIMTGPTERAHSDLLDTLLGIDQSAPEQPGQFGHQKRKKKRKKLNL